MQTEVFESIALFVAKLTNYVCAQSNGFFILISTIDKNIQAILTLKIDIDLSSNGNTIV